MRGWNLKSRQRDWMKNFANLEPSKRYSGFIIKTNAKKLKDKDVSILEELYKQVWLKKGMQILTTVNFASGMRDS